MNTQGYRVDLGEVESALLAHPQVQDAAVVVRPDPDGRPELVGYVVIGADLRTDTMREHLFGWLPEHMVPTAIVTLAKIPRDVVGKVAAASLPEPHASALRPRDFVAPHEGVERQLAEIISSVLGIATVSRFDDFFRLGGQSLTAVQLISRIRDGLGTELSLRDLFEYPTVAGLGAILSGQASGERPIPILGQQDSARASSAQQRLWLLQQLAPEHTGYNMVEALRLRGALEVSKLTQAIEMMAARHDVLRSRFELGDDHLSQTIDPDWALDVECVDLTALSVEQAWQRATEIVQEIGRRGYDLETGPLFEASVLMLGPDDHVLVVGVHHIVCDAWSFKVLLSEISAHYGDLLAGRAPQLSAPRIQYRDFAAWERGADHEAEMAEHLAYWRAQLAGAATELRLSTVGRGSEVGSGRGDIIRFHIPTAVTDALATLARDHKTTLFSGLLAGFEVALARWTGMRDIMVGVPVAGRTRAELEGLIGLFVNILPIRGDLSGAPTFDEFLEQIRDTTLSGYAHEALSFERMVELVNPTRDLGLNPLIQVTCQLFEESGTEGLQIEGLAVERLALNTPSSRFDLSLDLTRQVDGLRGEFIYDADLFERSTMECLAHAFQALLREATQDPARPVWEIPCGLTIDRRSQRCWHVLSHSE